jgi:hypothetical protein
MATQRQRRRREKLHRHEFEYVEVTPDGDEVVVEKPVARPAAKPRTDVVVNRAGRVVPKPSLQRVLKRTAIMGPILVAVVFLLGGSLTTGQKVFQAILLLAIFVPFSYFADRFAYRMALKRQAGAGADRGPSRR